MTLLSLVCACTNHGSCYTLIFYYYEHTGQHGCCDTGPVMPFETLDLGIDARAIMSLCQ